jgi:hypothetical protein
MTMGEFLLDYVLWAMVPMLTACVLEAGYKMGVVVLDVVLNRTPRG